MTKAGAVLLAVVSVSSQIAHAVEHPWKHLIGCFETTERNGYPVENGPYDAVASGQIQQESAWFLLDSSGNRIDSLSMFLFQKYSEADNAYYFDYQPVFTSFGTYSCDQNGLHYQFNGKLLGAPEICSGHCEFTLITSVDVTDRGGGFYGMKIKRTIPEVSDGSMDADDEYILKSIPCHSSELRAAESLTPVTPFLFKK